MKKSHALPWLVRRRLGAGTLAAWLLAGTLVLQGCGGGTGGDPDDPPAQAQRNEVTGRVTTGADSTPIPGADVRVKGSQGIDRTTQVRLASGAGASLDYTLDLSDLSGPYAFQATTFDNQYLKFSVSAGATRTNITPLTSLVVAELTGANPRSLFPEGSAGAGNGGFTGYDAAQIDAAQLRVRRFLQRELGVPIAASLGDFITTPFEAVAGDPMFDAIRALNARVAVDDFAALLTRVGEQSRRCRAERLRVSGQGADDLFCPFGKRYEFEEADPSIAAITFTTAPGETLVVRVRGDAVLEARLTTLENQVFGCSAAGCVGLTLGAPAGDGTRSVAFAGVSLSGATGQRVLDGSLRSAEPGIALPGLPCPTNRFYVLNPDRTAEGYCSSTSATPNVAGAVGQPNGLARIDYRFASVGDGTVPTASLLVTTDADRVVSVILRRFTADGANLGLPYRCRGADCAGVTLGAVSRVTDQGQAFDVRAVDVNGLVLRAVDADGNVSASDTLTVRAGLVAAYSATPPPTLQVADCVDPANAVAVSFSEANAPTTACAPSPDLGFGNLAGTSLDGAGNVSGYFVSSLLLDEFGSANLGNSVNVFVSGGVVTGASFDPLNGPSFRCSGAGCAGITVSAPDAMGNTTVRFANTVLTEIDSLGLAGDRTVTLNGRFVAPPP